MDEREKAVITEVFSKMQVVLKEAWFNEVLQYLHLERPNGDIQTIRQLIYEQWLFSDLSCSTRPTIRLPPFAKRSLLERDVVVQINWLLDIHTSMYSKLRQHMHCRNDNSGFSWAPENEIQDSESTTNRTFLMEVTDGQRKLRAVEYKKIDDLCLTLLPGTKMLVRKGTICRCNVLLLSPDNSTVLGGENEICQQNTPAVVLARRLGINLEKLKSAHYAENLVNPPAAVIRMEENEHEKIQSTTAAEAVRSNATTKPEAQKNKNKKIPVVSRTITSYFQPERKAISKHTVESKDSGKQQQPSRGSPKFQSKLEPESGHTSVKPAIVHGNITQLSLAPTYFSHTAISKQQPKLQTTMTNVQASSEPEMLPNSPMLTSRIQYVEKIMANTDMQPLDSTAQKSIEPVQSKIPSFRSNCIAEQNKTKDFETFLTPAQSRMQFSHKPSFLARFQTSPPQLLQPATKVNRIQSLNETRGSVCETVTLSKENEKDASTEQSVIPVWTVNLNRQQPIMGNSSTVPSGTIIPSSGAQEFGMWTAGKRQYTADENTTQFLANEFHMPLSTVHPEAKETDEVQKAAPVSAQELNSSNSLENALQKRISGLLQRQGAGIAAQASGTAPQATIPQAEEHAAFQASVGDASEFHMYRPLSSIKDNVPQKHPVSTALSLFQKNCVAYPQTQIQGTANSNTNSEIQKASEQVFTDKIVTNGKPTTVPSFNPTVPTVPKSIDMFERFRALNVVSIRQACQYRKFCLISYRRRVQPLLCRLLGGLQFTGNNWTATLRIADETCNGMDCLVDSDAINELLGYSPYQAQQAVTNNDRARVSLYKGRAQAMLEIFKRLDLIVTVEFTSSSDVLPLIVHITNLSTALQLC